MLFLNIPRLKVTIKAFVAGRHDEAAEVLLENCRWLTDEEYLAGGEMPTAPPDLDYCKTVLLVTVAQGRSLVVHVPDQKALNALAGYFWVEPRRLP